MLGSIEDPEIRVCLNQDKLCLLQEQLGQNLPEKFNEQICIADLEWLKAQSAIETPLHELLMGSEILLPQPVEIPRNSELEARIQRLKLEQQERDYRAMTKNVDNMRVKQPEDTIAYQMKQINRQLIAVLQFVFSVAAGFAFGFLGVELIVGRLDVGFRLLLGVICALVIALAEMYFLAKKLAEDDYPSPSSYTTTRASATTQTSKQHQD